MKCLYRWWLLCASAWLACEPLFSRNARISLLATALTALVLIATSMPVSVMAGWLLPDGASKDILLRLRERGVSVRHDRPPH